MKTTTTVQAQYYSTTTDSDDRDFGWTSVDGRSHYGTKMQAIEAIKEHRKNYPCTFRAFRIVTTVVTVTIEEI